MRSIYLLSNRVALVDVVPDHPWIVDRLLAYTGNKYYNGFTVTVVFRKAASEIAATYFQEYAYLLVHAVSPRGLMNPDFLFPNPSWEAPADMIPYIILSPDASYDRRARLNGDTHTDLLPNLANDPPALLL